MYWLYGNYVGGRGAVGLLIVRLVFGAGIMLHGWQKLHMPGGTFPVDGSERAAGLPPGPVGIGRVRRRHRDHRRVAHAAGKLRAHLQHARGSVYGPHSQGRSVCRRTGATRLRTGGGLLGGGPLPSHCRAGLPLAGCADLPADVRQAGAAGEDIGKMVDLRCVRRPTCPS